METAKFTLVFDGEALKDHTMNVKDLVPAMQALSQLVDESNWLLNNDITAVELRAQTGHPGCFELIFLLSQIKEAIGLIISISDLLTLIKDIFWLIEKLKGKRPDKVENINDGIVKITTEDQTFEIPSNLLKMYNSITIRTKVEKLLAPLKKDGIDKFQIKNSTDIMATVKKADISYYDAPKTKELDKKEVDEREFVYNGIPLYIDSLDFTNYNKWRLSSENKTITATIDDEVFKARVNQKTESFTKGDVLVCVLREKRHRTANRAKTIYSVETVIKHIKAMHAQQVSMQFDFPED